MAAELIEIERARELVLERAAPLPAESVELRSALGRTLAEDVVATERVPGFDNSAMDGYAVRSDDLAGAAAGTPVRMRPLGESRAGSPFAEPLASGRCVAISTGAMIPDGADAVVKVEDTRRAGEEVEFASPVTADQNVRRAGEDIEPGTALVAAGTTLGPGELGVLASVGEAAVRCGRRPRVAVLSTGDELIDVEAPIVDGQVRNSNSYSLTALVRLAGAELGEVSTVPDDASATREALGAGLEADVLVVCGGVSAGEHDHVKGAFAELGVEQSFWGVSLKPGKPVWFGSRAGTLVFGLPGNPVSAFVTFLLFVRPALRVLQGADPSRTRVEARLTERYRKPVDRGHAVRCRLAAGSRGWEATPASHQGSHVMTSMLGADGLALIPASVAAVEAGEAVTVELIAHLDFPS